MDEGQVGGGPLFQTQTWKGEAGQGTGLGQEPQDRVRMFEPGVRPQELCPQCCEPLWIHSGLVCHSQATLGH